MGVEGVKTMLEELSLEAFLIHFPASAHDFDFPPDVVVCENMAQARWGAVVSSLGV